MMESFQYLCMVFNLIFISFFVSKIINCINLSDSLQLCEYYVGVKCTNGKREQMWKHVMCLTMIQWECVSNIKQEWRFKIKIKNIIIVSNCVLITFLIEDFLLGIFCVWTCTFYFSFIVACTHLKCYTISNVHIIMCALCEKNWLK